MSSAGHWHSQGRSGAHLAAAPAGGAVCAQPLPPWDCLQPAAAQVGSLVAPIAQQQDIPLISTAGNDSTPHEGLGGKVWGGEI